MMAKALLLAVLSCPLVLGAADQPKHLTASDEGKTVAVKVGDRFDVALPGNPTTGFTWEIIDGPGRVVRQDGEREFRPDGPAIGSGGTFIFRFVASGEGAVVLRLVYHRKWEKDVPPARIFQVTLAVSA